MSYWTYLRRGLALIGVLAIEGPKAIEDGKLTVKEITDIVKTCYEVLEQPMEFEIPDEIRDTVIGVMKGTGPG